MYNQHFGFRESPFKAASSGQFFYTNELYREALANLRYGIEWRKGLIVMTGEVGTGKTTVLGKILRSLEATMHPIVVSSDHLTYFELLRFISKELGLPVDGRDRLTIIEQLRQDLVARHKKGHLVALLIDEAQSLSDEIFETIRFLSNLETEEGKLLQIVLAGQPELEKDSTTRAFVTSNSELSFTAIWRRLKRTKSAATSKAGFSRWVTPARIYLPRILFVKSWRTRKESRG